MSRKIFNKFGNKDRHGIHSINIKKLLILNKDRFLALSNAIKYRKNFYFKKPKKNLNWGRYKTITSPKIARLNSFDEIIF